MKLLMIVDPGDIGRSEAMAEVGGHKSVHEVKQEHTEQRVFIVCSDPLSDEQVQEVWDAGFLWTEDAGIVWESGDFDELVEEIREYAEEQADRCLECEREHGPHYSGRCKHEGGVS